MIKTKKVSKKIKVATGKSKIGRIESVIFKYSSKFQGLKKLEPKIIGLVLKLKSYKNVIGALPLKSSSQVIPLLQLFALGCLSKGKLVNVQDICKGKLGIVRDNFSLRAVNLFKALNKEKITSLQLKKSDCKFVENSKNRILEFKLS
jgi:hypothetical protein